MSVPPAKLISAGSFRSSGVGSGTCVQLVALVAGGAGVDAVQDVTRLRIALLSPIPTVYPAATCGRKRPAWPRHATFPVRRVPPAPIRLSASPVGRRAANVIASGFFSELLRRYARYPTMSPMPLALHLLVTVLDASSTMSNSATSPGAWVTP